MILKSFPDKQTFLELAKKGNLIPVCLEVLADTETPVSALAKIKKRTDADRTPVFLLESVEGGERWGRYSFLGASARSHVRIFDDRVELTGREATESIPHNGAPLAVLRSFMEPFKPVAQPEQPRFWGGLVGYKTY